MPIRRPSMTVVPLNIVANITRNTIGSATVK